MFRDITYRAPAYIQLAAKRKCNLEGIFIVGVPNEDLQQFKSSMKYHALVIHVPEEKGRAVVAIDSRCHSNTADFKKTTEGVNRHLDDEEEDKPDDWYDQFEITSKQDVGKQSRKTYQLELGSSTTKGANFNFKVSGAGFFNSVAPSLGAGGSYSKTTSQTQTISDGTSQSISQGYEIVDKLMVPPKTKVKARITTWAVTYESKTVTEVTIDAKAFVKVRYRTRLSRNLVGGIFMKRVKISAKELFRNEMDYKCEDDVVSFKREGVISHLGEEVEILKERGECSYQEEIKRHVKPLSV